MTERAPQEGKHCDESPGFYFLDFGFRHPIRTTTTTYFVPIATWREFQSPLNALLEKINYEWRSFRTGLKRNRQLSEHRR
jgi:hypothetical protein